MSVRTIIAQSKRTGHLVRLVPLFPKTKDHPISVEIDSKDKSQFHISVTLDSPPTAYAVEWEWDQSMLMNAPFVESDFEFLEEE